LSACCCSQALHITRRSKGNGRLLFLLYFAVSSIITVFTSNDIAIMTLTVRTTELASRSTAAAGAVDIADAVPTA
jgi:Na+/H+ antiporter NhaD/arsenite permease-like protein